MARSGTPRQDRAPKDQPDVYEAVLSDGNEQAALYRLTDRLYRASTIADVYQAAMDAIRQSLGCGRASILLFDDKGVMTFVAWSGLSETYRRAVDGHSPWTRDTADPRPIYIADIDTADFPADLKATVKAEGIGALAFIPLAATGRLIGKFMAYYDAPHAMSVAENNLAITIARQLGFAIERIWTEDARLRAEQAHRLLASIIETSGDAIVSKTLEGIVTSWNHGAEALFGYAPAEIIGRSITVLIPSERQHEETEIIGRIKRGESVVNLETMRIRKDGSLVDISLTVSPIKDESGAIVGASKIARDITDRKQADARHELLTQEIQHRTRNMFAVIHSVVARSFVGKQTLQEAKEAVLSRLRSLAQTHTMLIDKDWQGAGLAEVIETEMRPFSGRLAINGPPLQLSSKAAQNFALAIHELATNAAKYGALSNTAGRVRVRWSIDEPAGIVIFRWEERDGPPVVPPQRKGFGTAVLEQVMAEYFDEEPPRMQFEACGITYEVRCSLAAIAPPEPGS